MNNPSNLSYSKTHEWIETTESGGFRVGLTDYAQSSLGDIVFVNLPEMGESLYSGESFGDVESVKAVSDLYSPFTGTVAAVNSLLLDSPELINQEPYEAWLIEVDGVTDYEELLDADEYASFCEAQ